MPEAPEKLGGLTRKEWAAWGRGVSMTRWAMELRAEEKSETKREYNQRYRARHPKRIHAMQKVYKARHRAKQQGAELPQIPDWDKELGGFEVVYARGGRSRRQLAST